MKRARGLQLASSCRGRRGFTLLELLVVAGLIAVFAGFLFGALGGGGKMAALEASHAIVAQLLTDARLKAAATGRRTRLLVNTDVAQGERYLRLLVVQVGEDFAATPATWRTVQSVSLPTGAAVVPPVLAGLVTEEGGWRRGSDPEAVLRSDLFTNQSLHLALPGDATAQVWTGVAFTPQGTLAALAGGPPPKGYLVLAKTAMRRPDEQAAGSAAVRLLEPDSVCGFVLSAYGIPAPLLGREAF